MGTSSSLVNRISGLTEKRARFFICPTAIFRRATALYCLPRIDYGEGALIKAFNLGERELRKGITGYPVGDLSRWNNGKRAEEADRVKHGV